MFNSSHYSKMFNPLIVAIYCKSVSETYLLYCKLHLDIKINICMLKKYYLIMFKKLILRIIIIWTKVNEKQIDGACHVNKFQ